MRRSIFQGRGAFDDPDNYLPLARSLAAGDGFALKGRLTAYRPPLYPMLLAPSIAIAGNEFDLGDRVTCTSAWGRALYG